MVETGSTAHNAFTVRTNKDSEEKERKPLCLCAQELRGKSCFRIV